MIAVHSMFLNKPHTLFPLAFAIFLALSSCGQKKDGKADAEMMVAAKPNVIIVFTDDQGYGDLGYHGNPIIKTPNLDAFAEQSLELTNFHVGTTCAPTRAGLLTGRNANRNNAWHTIAGCSILLEDEELMPQVFERNGYKTTMFGKWHLGDNYPFRPQDRGFQTAFYHGGGGIQQTPDYWNNDYFDDTYFRNGEPEKVAGYCTDVWFDEAIAFTKKQASQPFFMYLALNAAHGPFNVPEKYAEMYASAALTGTQKRFYGMISNIDDNFGRLVNHLKETDQFDNTILIFTTDNGTAAGIKNVKGSDEVLGYNAGLRGIKGSHYDGGHKVPFFISWPDGKIQQNVKTNDLVAHVDILPTLTELADIPYTPKKVLDGQSMVATLRGTGTDIDRMLVVDTQRNQLPEKGRNPCVMKAEWRLVNGSELYNTIDDPGQENDISKMHPERVKNMQEFYEQWWATIQPDMRYAEIPLGHGEANPVMITVHDLHTQDNLPWNQVQIRKGEANPDGYYSVKVVEDGNYEFRLYRYPPESRLLLNAYTDEIPASDFVDGLPEGKKINPSKAVVTLGETVIQAKVGKDEPFAVLEGKLSKGSYQLKSNFIMTDGKRIPVNYTQIEKLTP